MINYERLFFKLFAGVTQAIGVLQAAQKETAEMLLTEAGPEIKSYEPEDKKLEARFIK